MNAKLNQIAIQPVDYQYISHLLSDYRYPRNKISKLLASGELVSLKRGLYVLAAHYKTPLVKETVANLLYGPSYISTDFALSYYGLIPERAYNITSVTTSRKKSYQTPIGFYSYQQLKSDYYALGYEIHRREGVSFLIATPEKALCDKLYLLPVQKDIREFKELIFDDLRISPYSIKELQRDRIEQYAQAANHKNLIFLVELWRNND
jgi:hypothetical protein